MTNLIVKEDDAPDVPGSEHHNINVNSSGVLRVRHSDGSYTIYPVEDADVASIAALSGTGFPARTATDTWALRSLAEGLGIDIANPAGVAGNPSIAVAPADFHIRGAQSARPAASVAGLHYTESDTGITSYDTGAAWVDLTTGKVVKTSDETVTNSTTLQDDNELLFPMRANEKYAVDLELWINAVSTVEDFKFGWNVPALCTYKTIRTGAATGVAAGSSPANMDSTSMSTGTVGGDMLVQIHTFIRNGSNAGNATFQWAMNTLSAVNLKVIADSYALIRRLS